MSSPTPFSSSATRVRPTAAGWAPGGESRDGSGGGVVPRLFLIGAAASGTTSLYRYLAQHPRFFAARPKELHFFADYPPDRRPRLRTIEEYLAHFAGCPEGSVACDASTSYLYSRRAPEEVARLRPDAAIAMILRDPTDRAYSLYWHNRRDSLEDLGFEEALAVEERRIREGWSFGFHYVRSGLYARQVSRWLDRFPRERVRIFLFEDFQRDPAGVCREVFALLGLDPAAQLDTAAAYNRTGPSRHRLVSRLLRAPFPGRAGMLRFAPAGVRRIGRRLLEWNVEPKPPMDPATRSRLRHGFEADVRELERLLGRDLRHWREA